MSVSYRVGLLGFTDFERAALDAFFRLTARRAVRYEHEPLPATADLLLVDGDAVGLLSDPRLESKKCVLIGGQPGSQPLPGALLHLPRPLNMMALLRQLDAKLGTPAAAPAPVIAPVNAPVIASVIAPAIAPVSAPLAPTSSRSGPTTQPDPPGAHRPHVMDDILVVDDSDIALRFMAEVLGRFGFDVHLARSGEDALRRVAQQHFEFVFLDVSMPGLDGHQTCKLIKNSPYSQGRLPPTVVMLTSRDAKADKLRGTMAGCDAYLTKPLQREALLKIVGDRVVAESAHAETQHDTLS